MPFSFESRSGEITCSNNFKILRQQSKQIYFRMRPKTCFLLIVVKNYGLITMKVFLLDTKYIPVILPVKVAFLIQEVGVKLKTVILLSSIRSFGDINAKAGSSINLSVAVSNKNLIVCTRLRLNIDIFYLILCIFSNRDVFDHPIRVHNTQELSMYLFTNEVDMETLRENSCHFRITSTCEHS